MILGVMFKNIPADAPHSLWPYWAAGYGALATVVPWLAGVPGNIDADEFNLRVSLGLGVFFALPLGVSAYWLSASPYYIISIGCWVLAALWVLHLLISSIVYFRKRGGA